MSIDIQHAYNILYPHFQERLCLNEPLVSHCAFGVGGPADIWVTLKSQQELVDLVNLCAEQHWPLLLVGSGRNIIFADAGVRGIVARIDFHHYQINMQTETSALLIVEAGACWDQILDTLLPLGWSGLEFGVGISGTLGAGIVSNAGARNWDLGQILEWIDVLDARGSDSDPDDQFAPATKRHYTRNELDLSYRHSRLRSKRSTVIDDEGKLVFSPRHLIEPPEIVLRLGLHLSYQDSQQLLTQRDIYLRERRQREPSLPLTGPIFKDHQRTSARDLIAQVGLQGQIHGKSQISEQNANYLVNLGGASAEDMLQLIVAAHQQVLRQCGIDLMLNVDLRGEWSHPDQTNPL
ncbi:UDP-N-acetylmuramate dehydrogenase [Ktedonospora formicarum]|uniref:UDP-N-acetylenolpyruvoylglucosamine reductase n=1 Tax=Ktedonospora formicarum TaxID=2778364 RepID=A0A8J3MQA4_9CHLR|nr:FAD-binding protein [Ktedonospora formicarum]GHO42418.1 UDP-N-acetylenolpyruvoylglucosamine reductase [Ktedonospora formicarum]